MSCLGELLWKTRRSLGLTIVEVARRAGYRNVNKGIRRYTDIETGSDVFPKEVIRRRFTEVLGLDEADILAAMLRSWTAPLPLGSSSASWPRRMPNTLYPGASLKEQLRLVREVGRTPRERVEPGGS